MKKEFTIRHTDELKRVGHYVGNLLKKEEKLTVIVKPFTPNYTDAQRGLYFQWMQDIGNEFGEDKDYYHQEFKKMFLINIYRRDKPWFQKMVLAMIKAREVSTPEEVEAVIYGILQLTSVRDANRKQMSEYMDSIKHYAAVEMSYAVRQPEDGIT